MNLETWVNALEIVTSKYKLNFYNKSWICLMRKMLSIRFIWIHKYLYSQTVSTLITVIILIWALTGIGNNVPYKMGNVEMNKLCN